MAGGAGDGKPALVAGIRSGARARAIEPGDAGGVVGDRESDLYVLLQWQSRHREEAGLVCGRTGAASAKCRCGTRGWER